LRDDIADAGDNGYLEIYLFGNLSSTFEIEGRIL
jgi:hypothetical protein